MYSYIHTMYEWSNEKNLSHTLPKQSKLKKKTYALCGQEAEKKIRYQMWNSFIILTTVAK